MRFVQPAGGLQVDPRVRRTEAEERQAVRLRVDSVDPRRAQLAMMDRQKEPWLGGGVRPALFGVGRLCRAPRAGFVISWRDRTQDLVPGKSPGKSGVRTKYTCPACGVNAWAKPDTVLRCGTCEVLLEPNED